MLKTSNLKFLMWALSVLTYVLAAVNRGSFSALGIVAQEHFSAEAALISTFVVVQLAVYAAAQIPVGILLDRLGASVMLCAGLFLMGCGQFMMGMSSSVPLALAARVFVGAGDACIFVSMIKVISDWFSAKAIPSINQISGLIGQSGMLIAVTPLAASVALLGWTGAFSSLALIALALMVLIFILLKDTPGSLPLARRLFRPQNTAIEQRTSATTAASPITDALPVLGPGSSGIVPALKSLLKRPGVRLGFWVHFATCFSTNSFVLLWGLPFMTGGLGYSFATASTIVSLNVVAIMAAGLIAGPLFTRFMRQRVEIVTGLVVVIAAFWCAVLLYPGGAPVWLMTLTAMIGGIGGPASMVAFEVVRTHAPYTQRGIATGIANMGGFLGALVNVLAIGLILDFTGAGTPDTYNLESFRGAMAFQVPMMILGITMMLIERPKAQKYLREKGLR